MTSAIFDDHVMEFKIFNLHNYLCLNIIKPNENKNIS